MEQKNLDRAMEVFGALLVGEEIRLDSGKNSILYTAYHENSEVCELVDRMLKQMNLRLYEYDYGMYLCAGNQNRIFGYTNDELKRVMNLRLNKELYLCYYLMFQAVRYFYNDSASYTYAEYIKIEDIIAATDAALKLTIENSSFLMKNEQEEHSIEMLAMTWDELPVIANDDIQGIRAGRGSKTAYVKLVFNFLVSQNLFVTAEERYYPTNRFHALIRGYFEEERTRLYELLQDTNRLSVKARENDEEKDSKDREDNALEDKE